MPVNQQSSKAALAEKSGGASLSSFRFSFDDVKILLAGVATYFAFSFSMNERITRLEIEIAAMRAHLNASTSAQESLVELQATQRVILSELSRVKDDIADIKGKK